MLGGEICATRLFQSCLVICPTLVEEETEININHTLKSKMALCMDAGKSKLFLVRSSHTDSHTGLWKFSSVYRLSKTLWQAFYSVLVSVKDILVRAILISRIKRICNYLIAHCKNKLIVLTTRMLGCRLAYESFFKCWIVIRHTTTTHWQTSEHLWGNYVKSMEVHL